MVAGLALAIGWAGPVINKVTVVKQGSGAVVRVSGTDLAAPKLGRTLKGRAWIASFDAALKTKPQYLSLKTPNVRYVQFGWYRSKPPVVRVMAWLQADVTPQVTRDGATGDWLIHIGVPNGNKPNSIAKPNMEPTIEIASLDSDELASLVQAALAQETDGIRVTAVEEGDERVTKNDIPAPVYGYAAPQGRRDTVTIPTERTINSSAKSRIGAIARNTGRDAVGEYQGPQVSLDFTNTDLTQIVKALAMQTNSNIVVAPDIQKSLTVRISGESLTTALDLITKMAGCGYIRQGKTYIVGTTDFLKSWSPETAHIEPTNVAKTVTEIYSVHAADPKELGSALGVVAPGVKATPGPASGSPMLILQGVEEDVLTAMGYLPRIDVGKRVPPPAEFTTEIYTTKYVDSRDLAKFFDGETSLVKGVSVQVGPGKIIAKEDLGGTKISQGQGGGGSSSGGQGGGSGAPAGGGGNLSAGGEQKGQPPRNLIVSGSSPLVAQALSLLAQMDTPQPQVVIEVRVMDVLRDDLDNLGIQWDVFNKGVINLQNINRVSTSRENDGSLTGSTNVTDKNGNNTTDTGSKNTTDTNWKKTFDTLGDPVINAFNLSLNPKTLIGSVNGILDALVTKKRSKLLANPKVSVIDGEKAQFFIGDDIKYVESSQVTQTGTTFQIGTVLAGIQLNAIPRIAPDGTVTLALHPEVSLISSFNDVPGGGKLPQVARRFVDTTVRMQDGQTLVIGGLIRQDEIDTMRRVPFLSDLPFLGQFFKHRSKTFTNSEVVVFLTVRLGQS